MTIQKGPVTLKTIATILGLTPATISKALRDSTDISKKTRSLVKNKARELGYHPNIMAKSLIENKSNILGVIVPDLNHSFFADIAKGICEGARQSNYETIIMVHDENENVEKSNLTFLSALNVDGIVIAAVPGVKNNDLIQRIDERGIPFVCFDRIIDGLNFCAVTIDDEKSSLQVVDYFINKGREDIVFIGPTTELFVAKGRFDGYRKGLAKHKIEFRDEYVIECSITHEDAQKKMQQFIDSNRTFNAVICVSGVNAYGTGKAIISSDLNIPEDVMLAEFGNNHIVHKLGVPFISVEQFPDEMGRKAVSTLIDVIDSKQYCNEHIFLDTELIFHHSNGRDEY